MMNTPYVADRNRTLVDRMLESKEPMGFRVQSADGTHMTTTDYMIAIREALIRSRMIPGLTTVSVDGIVLNWFALLAEEI